MPFDFIVNIIDKFFQLIQILILLRIVMSWIQIPDNNVTRPLMSFVYDVTEPILGPLRNMIPPITLGGMGWDLSPIIAFLLLGMVQKLVLSALSFFMK